MSRTKCFFSARIGF